MITLTNQSTTIELVLGGAITTNQLDYVVCWENVNTNGLKSYDTQTGTSNNTTAVTIVPAPPAGNKRNVMYISIHNSDTVAASITTRYNDRGTIRRLAQNTANANSALFYEDQRGWYV